MYCIHVATLHRRTDWVPSQQRLGVAQRLAAPSLVASSTFVAEGPFAARAAVAPTIVRPGPELVQAWLQQQPQQGVVIEVVAGTAAAAVAQAALAEGRSSQIVAAVAEGTQPTVAVEGGTAPNFAAGRHLTVVVRGTAAAASVASVASASSVPSLQG